MGSTGHQPWTSNWLYFWQFFWPLSKWYSPWWACLANSASPIALGGLFFWTSEDSTPGRNGGCYSRASVAYARSSLVGDLQNPFSSTSSCTSVIKISLVLTHIEKVFNVYHTMYFTSGRRLTPSSSQLTKVSSSDSKECKIYRTELERYCVYCLGVKIVRVFQCFVCFVL